MLVLQGMMGIIESIKIHYIQTLLFCCMVVGYFYFGYIDFIGPLSLGVVSLVVLFSISCFNGCMRSSGTFPNPHVTISVVLILLALWLYVVAGVGFVQLLRRIGIPIMLIFAVREAIKSVRQVNSALVIIAIIVSISCIVAVLQAIHIDFFWDLRMMLGTPHNSTIAYQIANRVRTPGLALFSVPLAYQISVIFPFVMYLTLISRTRKKIIILGLCLVLGALASKSLSAFMAILVSYIVFMKLNHLLSPKRLFRFIIIIIFLVIGMSCFNDFVSRIITLDRQALSRIPFTLIGVRILSDVPFGVKSGAELTNLMHYYLADYGHLRGARDLLEIGFHNCLLTVGISYGWAILIVYIWLYLYVFRLIYKAMKNSTIGSADHYFYSSAIAYFCAYIIQSFTHNAGLTTSDPWDWIMIAVILAYKPSRVSAERL
ncbi:MAG: hypothetical protein ACUZ8N_15380 [Candidatus Scalindua sp.]